MLQGCLKMGNCWPRSAPCEQLLSVRVPGGLYRRTCTTGWHSNCTVSSRKTHDFAVAGV